ncbi:MAG TPA: DUF488 domain-containing protein [Solirubrobacterales bacterium]
MAGRIATIGVYGFDQATFLRALAGADVDIVVDVRQRRGVRGSEYAWANSRRLQTALAEAGVEYRHMKELAPTTAMREAQYREDARRGEGKRSRTELAPVYRRLYTEQVLDPADLSTLIDLTAERRPALLCVERDARACHRSLIAERLRREAGVSIRDLEPQASS